MDKQPSSWYVVKHAILYGKISEEILSLIEQYIDKQDFVDGFTLLHTAVLGKQEHYAQLLLQKGADCNTIDNCGNSPLHTAIYYRNKPLVTLLLDHGALCNSVNKFKGCSLIGTALSQEQFNENSNHWFVTYKTYRGGPISWPYAANYLAPDVHIAQMMFNAYHRENIHQIRPATLAGLAVKKIIEERYKNKNMISAFIIAKKYGHEDDLQQLRTLKGVAKDKYVQHYLNQLRNKLLGSPAICDICKELEPITRFELICPVTKQLIVPLPESALEIFMR
ncbi:MAG: ankyrin repeat domain-containing protein [Candidatus Babeliaceae bacterium]